MSTESTEDVPEDGRVLGQPEEGDVITRRMQFRLKKRKREDRQIKKEENARKKVEKEKEKEEKKRVKEQKKQQQIKEKKAAAETKGKKRKAKEIAQENHEDDHEKISEDKVDSVPEHKPTSPVNRKRKTISKPGKPTRLEKLRRLQSKMAEAKPGLNAKEIEEPKAPEESKAPEGAIAVKEAPKKGRSKANKASAACKDAPSLQETGGSTKKPRKPRTPKSNTGATKKAECNKSKGNTSKRNKQQKKEVEPCPKIVEEVIGVLEECHTSNCVHPSWESISYDKKVFSVSTYWTRNAVGVKVARKHLPKNGGKGKGKWSQVAYFGGETTCIYSNMFLAYKFVTCMQRKGLELLYCDGHSHLTKNV